MNDEMSGAVIWLPLLAAILFSFAAIFIKRASKADVDLWRICFVSNITTFLAFLPFAFFIKEYPTFDILWQPVFVASLFIVGQVFTLLAMTDGDISVAAPVLGLKMIFVPLLLWLFQVGELPSNIALACIGATLSVLLLNYFKNGGNRRRVLFSFITASLGAFAYAMFDVSIQSFSSKWDQAAFLPAIMSLAAVLSLGFIPFFKFSLSSIPASGWKFLLIGSILFAFQAIAISSAIAYYGHAAAANVVYSSRGIWSLIFVWLIGRWLSVSEEGLSKTVFAVRMIGAVLLLASIFLLAI